MRMAWERIAAVIFSGAAWLLVLLGAPHMLHALRGPPRLIAHASMGRRRES